MDRTQLIVITAEVDPELTLEEICNACQVEPEFIQQLIDYGVIEPKELSQGLSFGAEHLYRVKRAVHLHRDLEINMAGIALILEMLEQMESMQNRLDWLEKFI